MTRDIINRIKSTEGQMRGLSTMLENDNDPEKVLIQFKAVQKAFDKAHFLLLDEVYRKTLAINIVEALDACPGNCGNEERIEFMRKNFPNLKMDDLSRKMNEITELKKRIQSYNDQSS